MYSSTPFGLEGGMWDLIVLISDHFHSEEGSPDHCHSKEDPLYFLPLVKEALVYILCLFLYLERFYLHIF